MIRKKISIMAAFLCTAALCITGCNSQPGESETIAQSETESMTAEEREIVSKVKGIKNYTVSAASVKDKDVDTAREDIKKMIMQNVSNDDFTVTELSLDVSQVNPAVCDNYKIYFNATYMDDENNSKSVSIERNLLLAEQSVADMMVKDNEIVLGYEKQDIKETETIKENESKETEKQTERAETEKRETVAAETRETKETEKETEKRETEKTKPAETKRNDSSISVTEKQEPETVKHEHRYTSKITTKPTCTDEGIRTYTCVCGHSYSESVPATGHQYDHGVITTEPTCTSEGIKTYTCANCGRTYTETVQKAAHNWIIKTEKVFVDDENGGHYESVSKSICSVCGAEK